LSEVKAIKVSKETYPNLTKLPANYK
jgi:hypothetical protein